MKFDIEKIKIKDIDGNEIQIAWPSRKAWQMWSSTEPKHWTSTRFPLIKQNRWGWNEQQTAQTVAAIIGDSQMYYFVKQPIINYLNTLKCEKKSKTKGMIGLKNGRLEIAFIIKNIMTTLKFNIGGVNGRLFWSQRKTSNNRY